MFNPYPACDHLVEPFCVCPTLWLLYVACMFTCSGFPAVIFHSTPVVFPYRCTPPGYSICGVCTSLVDNSVFGSGDHTIVHLDVFFMHFDAGVGPARMPV